LDYLEENIAYRRISRSSLHIVGQSVQDETSAVGNLGQATV